MYHEIRGLAPGSYTVRANFIEDKDTYIGEQTIEVGPQGAQNVEIAALPDFAAAGHVTLTGNPPKDFHRVLIEFVGQGLLPRVRASAVFPELKFEAQLRPEKRYYANIRNLPEDYYLKSVAISGLIGWFVLQVVAASSVQVGSAGGGVAYFAHIGGFIFGLFTIKWWVRKNEPRPPAYA